jgi:hypothetical protein
MAIVLSRREEGGREPGGTSSSEGAGKAADGVKARWLEVKDMILTEG